LEKSPERALTGYFDVARQGGVGVRVTDAKGTHKIFAWDGNAFVPAKCSEQSGCVPAKRRSVDDGVDKAATKDLGRLIGVEAMKPLPEARLGDRVKALLRFRAY